MGNTHDKGLKVAIKQIEGGSEVKVLNGKMPKKCNFCNVKLELPFYYGEDFDKFLCYKCTTSSTIYRKRQSEETFVKIIKVLVKNE